MAKQKARKKLSKKVDLTVPLAPIDVEAFGTDDDPCFGKLHDMTQDECKRCGDNSICQIVFNQATEKLRANEEKTSRFKDLELNKKPDRDIGKFIKSRLEKGLPTLSITKQVIKKFSLNKDEAKSLVKTEKIKWKKS